MTERKEQGRTGNRMSMIEENMQDITAHTEQPEARQQKGKGARKHAAGNQQAFTENASDMTARAIKPEKFTGGKQMKTDHANSIPC